MREMQAASDRPQQANKGWTCIRSGQPQIKILNYDRGIKKGSRPCDGEHNLYDKGGANL